jgi:hypothetical protein
VSGTVCYSFGNSPFSQENPRRIGLRLVFQEAGGLLPGAGDYKHFHRRWKPQCSNPALQPVETMEGEQPIYIARTLADAQKLEDTLKTAGIEYDVEPDSYQGGLIFRSTRIGAFFYVEPEIRDRAVSVMQEKGFRPFKP